MALKVLFQAFDISCQTSHDLVGMIICVINSVLKSTLTPLMLLIHLNASKTPTKQLQDPRNSVVVYASLILVIPSKHLGASET